ncbi:MAG: primosome assembly protein PriA, partial [Actinomycetota bacterium]|nr:primosome assembly protein PriA [Actinomycetota bacterium]
MRFARVLVEVEPDHLDRPFDYALPAALAPCVEVGSRVEVDFAGRRVRGLVVALTDESSHGKVREVRRVLGPHTWATPEEIEVLRWAAERFAAPTAAVIRHALPPQRVRDVERRAEAAGWFPPGRAPRPPDPPHLAVDESAWGPYGTAGSRMRAAAERGGGAYYWRPLPDENLAARLVELAHATLAGGRDVLLVVPEPRSPAADALASTFRDVTVDARGGPRARRLYRGWLEARCGRARVVIGERGVAFWHLARLGLGVIVDEANPALKERRAPRHHAREVVLERTRRAGAAAVLVGTVPSAAA